MQKDKTKTGNLPMKTIGDIIKERTEKDVTGGFDMRLVKPLEAIIANPAKFAEYRDEVQDGMSEKVKENNLTDDVLLLRYAEKGVAPTDSSIEEFVAIHGWGNVNNRRAKVKQIKAIIRDFGLFLEKTAPSEEA